MNTSATWAQEAACDLQSCLVFAAPKIQGNKASFGSVACEYNATDDLPVSLVLDVPTMRALHVFNVE